MQINRPLAENDAQLCELICEHFEEQLFSDVTPESIVKVKEALDNILIGINSPQYINKSQREKDIFLNGAIRFALNKNALKLGGVS